MKLHGSYTSPYVRHARIALLETGLTCEFVETDLAASAQKSPTKKIPLLEDGELLLSDSSTIVRYLREKAGSSFLPTLKDHELFCMASTALDAGINVFYLEKDGILPMQSAYLERQASRVGTSLSHLEMWPLPTQLVETTPLTDGELRLACFLDWGLFRYRIDLSGFPNLAAFLELARSHPSFAETAPPAHLR